MCGNGVAAAGKGIGAFPYKRPLKILNVSFLMKKDKVPTIDQQAQYAWMKGGKVDRQMIEEFLVRDLKGIHVLLTELLSDQDVIDAITKVICDKYQKALDVKKLEPELPLNYVPK